MNRAWLGAAATILSGSMLWCAEALAAPDEPPRSLTGKFGGNGAGLDATEAVMRLTFDCATGSIDGPIALDDQGRFDVSGRFERDGPGPARPDSPKGGEPARYTGRLEGETLTLSLRPAGSDQVLGPFTLIRGRVPHIRSCG
jgi:hypothetical protein